MKKNKQKKGRQDHLNQQKEMMKLFKKMIKWLGIILFLLIVIILVVFIIIL